MIYHSIFTSHVSETNFVLRTISPTKISNFSTFSTCVVMQTFLQWAWNKVVVHEDDAGLMSVSAPHLGLDTPDIHTQAKKKKKKKKKKRLGARRVKKKNFFLKQIFYLVLFFS